MEHRRQGAIYFNADEKAVIEEYPEVLINRISAYVAQYGTKPDGSNAFILLTRVLVRNKSNFLFIEEGLH